MVSRAARCGGTLLLALGLGLSAIVVASHVGAAEATVGLGTAGSFAVLGGSTVTNTGPSVISGDLGVSPGTAVVGFPPGAVINGTIHAADAEAALAQADVTTAYNDAAGRSPTATVTADLAGQRLIPGVYRGTTTLALNGTLTLDALNDPAAVFIFQSPSTLITGADSSGPARVLVVNGANPCNVFWQVGSSATLGTNTSFVGTILALTSITAETGATVEPGRLLARNGAVTLDTNRVFSTACAASAPATTTTTNPAATTSTTQPGTTTSTSTTQPGATTTTTEPAGTTTTTSTSQPAATTTTTVAAVVATTSTTPETARTAAGSGLGTQAGGTAGGGSSTGAGRSTGDGASSTGETARTVVPLAATGLQFSGTLAAGLLAIVLGVGMLLASGGARTAGEGRRRR